MSYLQKKWINLGGKNIGMIFQNPYFVRKLNILDNLLLSLYLSKNIQDKNVIQLLNELGLGNKLDSMPEDLSQGEQKEPQPIIYN